MKLLDQGTLKSMVVNSEDVLNLIAGRSYSAGGHNLHFSTRILKHVRILTPDTNSEARANSDIWHEFWSTREFWHHFISSCSLMFGTRKFWHQNRWHKYFHFFPIPTQASPKEWPPLLSSPTWLHALIIVPLPQTCSRCSQTSQRNEDFRVLALPIPNSSSTSLQYLCTLCSMQC